MNPGLFLLALALVPLVLVIVVRNVVAFWTLRGPRAALLALGPKGWGWFGHVGPRTRVVVEGKKLDVSVELVPHGKPRFVVRTPDIPESMKAARVPIPVPEPAWCKVKNGKLRYQERVAASGVTREWIAARLDRVLSVIAATARVRRPDKPKDRFIPV